MFPRKFPPIVTDDRRHIPQESVLDSSSTIKVLSPSHGGFIFFFQFYAKKSTIFRIFRFFGTLTASEIFGIRGMGPNSSQYDPGGSKVT